jgi:hypothetical protein
MANKRTYWAIEGMGTGVHGAGVASAGVSNLSNFQYCPGVQSIGMSTNFNLEQIFQLGQLEIYQDLEDIPDVELTIEKVMDDTCLLYTRCVASPQDTVPGDYVATWTGSKTITSIQNNRVDIAFAVTGDTVDNIGDLVGGKAGLQAAYMSGMFVSSVNFNFGTDGFFTENITLVGNHQKWFVPAAALMASSPTAAAQQTGDVSKRHNFSFDAIGDVPAPLATVGATPADLRISSISVSTDFGREEMFALGEKQPYHRYVTFPIEVTCDIEAYVTDVADMGVDALPEADVNVQNNNTIKFAVHDGTSGGILGSPAVVENHNFDLGAKNILSSFTWNGLSTDGTNATVTYSYRNFNTMTVTSNNRVIQP